MADNETLISMAPYIEKLAEAHLRQIDLNQQFIELIKNLQKQIDEMQNPIIKED